MTKIAILEYSLYGHITQLSRSIKKWIESVGVEVQHLRCAETLPSEVLLSLIHISEPTRPR